MNRLPFSLTALALGAVFTVSSIMPAEAMPVPRQQMTQTSDVQNVKVIKRNHKNWRGNKSMRGSKVRHSRNGWRSNNSRRSYYNGHARGHYGYWRGHRGYGYYRPGYRRYNGFWYPAAVFTTGVVIGTTVNRGANSHVRWCRNNYASYRVSDNTFQPYNGPRRECVSP